jgi:hypothetical protein
MGSEAPQSTDEGVHSYLASPAPSCPIDMIQGTIDMIQGTTDMIQGATDIIQNAVYLDGGQAEVVSHQHQH